MDCKSNFIRIGLRAFTFRKDMSCFCYKSFHVLPPSAWHEVKQMHYSLFSSFPPILPLICFFMLYTRYIAKSKQEGIAYLLILAVWIVVIAIQIKRTRYGF